MKKVISLALSLLLVFSCISFVFAEETEEPEILNYVVLGDSIAYGAGLMNPQEAVYGKIVANTNGYNYSNFAINGSKTVDLINRLGQSNVREAIAEADIISISIGGNDLLKNLLSLIPTLMVGNKSVLNKRIESMYSNITTSIEMIRELNPDAEILLQTIYNNGGYLIFYAVYENALKYVNPVYYKIQSENENVEVVDIYSAFKGNGVNICGDTIHPNSRGNKIIAEEVLKTLYNLGLGETTEPVILAEPVTTIGFSPANIYYAAIYLFKATTAA